METRGLTKYFKDKYGVIMTAVDDVSLWVEPKEILAIVGQTGSGKTTLGRMTAGLTEPSKGTVLLKGTDIWKNKDMKSLWKKVQYIHQDPYGSMDPYMTVNEVLERPLRYLLEVHGADLTNRISRMMDVIGLDKNFLTKRIQELSGGERQRVLIARAFITTPLYVVADEPTTMIDFVHRNLILNLLLRLRNEFDATFMVITHDLSIAADICDRIAIMHDAKIIEAGPKRQVLESPREEYTRALLAATPDKLVSKS